MLEWARHRHICYSPASEFEADTKRTNAEQSSLSGVWSFGGSVVRAFGRSDHDSDISAAVSINTLSVRSGDGVRDGSLEPRGRK